MDDRSENYDKMKGISVNDEGEEMSRSDYPHPQGNRRVRESERDHENFIYDDDEEDDHDHGYGNRGGEEEFHEGQGMTGGRTKNILSKTHEGEFPDDYGDIPHDVTPSVYLYAMCAAINSVNLGYDIGVNTDASLLLRDSMNLSDVQLEVFMGSLNLFAMVGGLSSHWISDKYGRRGAFMVAACSFIIGVIIMSLGNSYSTLMSGRVFVGLGVGFGLAIDPIYIAEISPASHRGRLVTWSEIATNIGIVLGFSSGLIFRSVPAEMAWRYMFGMGCVLPAVMMILVCTIMPESPRWLVQHNREDKAYPILQKIYGDGFDVQPIIDNIKDNILKEQEAEHAVGWDVILFPTPAFRRMLIVGLGTAVAQQVVGIDAIQYFLNYILAESGIKDRTTQSLILICLGIVKLGFIIFAGRVFDRSGRRIMFFISLGGMTFSLLILSFTFYGRVVNAPFAIFGLSVYLATFSLGMGPGAWLIPSEIFTTSIRAKAMSIATFLNRVAATLMSSTFLTVAHALSFSGFFLLLATICLIVTFFLYTFLPETKGRALEDMAVYFAEITGDQTILEVEFHHRQERQEMQPNNDVDQGNQNVQAAGLMA